MEILSNKSGVDKNLITDLINQIKQAQNDIKVSDRALIDLNKNIEQFYLQSR